MNIEYLNTKSLYIQKIYKGFKLRKKLYIFNKLPNDIQYIIEYYINKEYYIKKQEIQIQKIVTKKLYTFNIKMLNFFNKSLINIDDLLLYEDDIIKNICIFCKYNILIDNNIKKFYNNIDVSIISIINNINYNNDYNSSSLIEINENNDRINFITELLDIIYTITN